MALPLAPTASADKNVTTLQAQLYWDADAYAAECRNIFFKEWLIFCHESQVAAPGEYVAYTVAGRPILVIRGSDGQLKAFHNVCRHRASMVLKEGCGKAAALRCMYHGWVYDTNGKLKKAPGFGGDEQSLCDRTSLFPVSVKSWHGMVFISMADKPVDFDTSIGDLPAVLKGVDIASFKYFDSATHPLKCNWKTYIENYMEGYHIPAVHPELNKEVDMTTYQVVPGRRLAKHVTSMRAENPVNDGLWVWVWPNAALNIYKNGMNLELAIPTGPETVELRYCYLFKDVSEAAADANRRTIDMSFLVTGEDIEICEIVQKNLKAGIYKTGELSPRHEGGLAYFQDLVREAG